VSLPKFIGGMLLCIVVVAIWSYLDSAGIGVIVLRVIVSAIVLQVGYFLCVLLMVALTPKDQAKSLADSRKPVDASKSLPVDKFPAK
jgi:exopolysaccharide production repressor protein